MTSSFKTGYALTAAAFGICLACAPAWCESPSRLQHRAFEILRDGHKIGRSWINVVHNGEQTDVATMMETADKLLIFPIHQFEHTENEIWRHHRLVALHAWTKFNGDVHKVDAAADGDHLTVMADGVKTEAGADLLPTSLWRGEFGERPRLLDDETGAAVDVTVEDLGEEQITAGGRSISAHHLKLHGGLDRDLWYDDANLLAKVQYRDKDGAEIVFVGS